MKVVIAFCAMAVAAAPGLGSAQAARAKAASADRPASKAAAKSLSTDKGGATALDADEHLVGWWKFDETSGKSAADSSKKGHPGVLEGGLSFETHSVPGRIGTAISLDGKDGCVRITGFKGVTGTQPRTVAAWIKTTKPSGEIVSWGLSDFGKMWTMSFIRSRVGVTPKGGYYYMKAGVHDNEWHHVAAVLKEGAPPNLHDNVRLYRDGVLAEIDDIGLLDLWPIETGDKEDVRIGWRFNGLIDDLRIYDRALSDDEIKALSNPESKVPSTSPKEKGKER
jgi:hypothetical protein